MTDLISTSPGIRRTCLAVCAGLGIFTGMIGLAIHLYPGGNPFDPRAGTYSGIFNSICDLGRTRGWGGTANVWGLTVFAVALMALGASLAGMFQVLGRIFPSSPGLMAPVRCLGAGVGLGLAGIGLTPADIMPSEHLMAIGVTALFGVPTFCLILGALLRDYRQHRFYTWFTLAIMGLGGQQMYKVVDHFILGGPWTAMEPLMPKVLVGLGLVWMGLGLSRCWELAQPAATPAPAALRTGQRQLTLSMSGRLS